MIKNHLLLSQEGDDDVVEHRYEARGDTYTLRSWRSPEVTTSGLISHQPVWLERVVALAVVGGHAQKIPNPPPNLIVWFRTSAADDTLVTFIDFDTSTPSATFQLRN